MGKDQELLEAARSGNVTVVEKILGQRAKRSGPLASLRRGPGANVQDASGYSALHHAALNGHRDVVKLLMQHEASTNVVDAKGSSPLHLAAWAGNSDIVKLILSQGPSIPNVNLATLHNETALHCAAQYGHTEVVAQLLQYGCDPGIRNSRGESALDLAAQYGRLETVQLLVRRHPELIEPLRSSSSSRIFPHTPLHLASRNGHRAVVEVLLESGVDVNTRTSAGTAMHEAALCGKMEVVRTLLDRGVDLGIRDSRHNTVLDLLGQFPPHVTQDITAVIKRHRSPIEGESDGDSENLPPIPVQSNDSLGSPYENVRPGDDMSPVEGSSPTQWQFYHKPRDEDRRVSGTSVMSFDAVTINGLYENIPSTTGDNISDLSSLFDSVFMPVSDTLNSISTFGSYDQTPDEKSINTSSNTTPVSPHNTTRGSDSGLYQTPPVPRGTESSYASEDLSLTLPQNFSGRESDQLSVSSSSSIGGPSPRERRFIPNDSGIPGIYLPMAPLSSSLHSPASNSKVSPTPPKKTTKKKSFPVSPTHLQTQMSLSADCSLGPSNYEYICFLRTGRSQSDLEQLKTRRDQLRHITRSVDQYVDMTIRNNDNNNNNNKEPVALTAVYGDRLVKLQNPRRKLRRNCEKSYENYEYDITNKNIDESPCSESSLYDQNYVTNSLLGLKTSQESLLDKKRDNNYGQLFNDGITTKDKRLKRIQMMLPTSPTHYVQPPTPDHPPPSAMHAEKSIHERIRPLSQVYKRRSRDMETEIEEELLQFQPGSLDASSGSLSSVSLSDKSMSTDNVEEYFGDVPFAVMSHSKMPAVWGSYCFKWLNPFSRLLKGSVIAERPKTLRKLKNVYGQNNIVMGTGADCSVERLDDNKNDNDKDDKSLSIMSPFDEQEEWAKISEIMASFGTGLVRESVFVTELEQEFQSRLGFTNDIKIINSPTIPKNINKWLININLSDYESLLLNYGYDDLDFINGILDDNDLKDMGITSEHDRLIIMNSSLTLNKYIDKIKNIKTNTVDEWLNLIHLNNYSETFKKHLYCDMERVKRVWEVELAAVLEIQKPGHRKRILSSVTGPTLRGQTSRNGGDDDGGHGCGDGGGGGPNLEDLNKDLNTLKSSIQQLKEEIREKLPETNQNNGHNQTTVIGTNATTSGTLRHRKNRPAPQPPQRPNSHNGTSTAPEQLEIRAPSELLFGVPSTLKTQWRHQPKALVTGTVTYIANYLGSTVVKELRGTESTKKSIQKLKKTCRDPRVSLGITLAISYRGVRFLDASTSEPICDHEIRNIHCACQDADDLTHFAYITKDHASRTHFCHVFCVPTMDQATEVILTLGQAFEVAYQMALREKIGNQTVRSQSANQLASLSSGNTINSNINSTNDNNNINDDKIIQNTGTLKSKIKIKKNDNCNTNTLTKNSTNNILNNNSNIIKNSSNITTTNGNSSTITKPLITHGRSHSVNDIKINGNQLKLVPTPVDDIGVGVKDMKPGSRAPIALSEEL